MNRVFMVLNYIILLGIAKKQYFFAEFYSSVSIDFIAIFTVGLLLNIYTIKLHPSLSNVDN